MFEYKHKKYNWTQEQFNEFNKSRAITKDNLIKKYGEQIGTEKWNKYLYLQHYTKSFDYMIDKYGIENATQINKSKGLTLENFINKYGDVIGNEKFEEILNRLPKFYSNISQKCFNEIDKLIGNKYKTYYATKNTEYGIKLKNKYICLDYFIKDLNICIEFNGTHFHADKRFYTENDLPNPFNKDLTAKEIWKNDSNRYNELLNKGIKTFIIWEYDYVNNLINLETFIKETLHINI